MLHNADTAVLALVAEAKVTAVLTEFILVRIRTILGSNNGPQIGCNDISVHFFLSPTTISMAD
jgi:hypothetical protein